MSAAVSWISSAQQLAELLQCQSSRGNEARVLQLLGTLNTLVYPIENLKSEAVEGLLHCFVECDVISVPDGEYEIEVAKLTYNVLTYQNATIQPSILTKLLHLLLSSLATAYPPNELLYASATIINLGIPHEDPVSLLNERNPVSRISLTTSHSVEAQRAGLHFLTALCDKSELPRAVLLTILDTLLQSIGNSYDVDHEKTSDLLLLNKLLLSRLRLFYSLLPRLTPLPSLAPLLSVLKANMAVGLPGQGGRPSSISSIQPPLAIPHSSAQPSPKLRPMHSMAGPQERKPQGKKRNRNRSKTKAKHSTDSGSRTGSDDSSRQSSDSESSSSASASEVLLPPRGGAQQEGDDATMRKGKEWRHGKRGVSSSEGEVSDSDTGSAKFKTVLSKIRHQTLSCLALVFQLLDRHTAFSYWLSFLSDGPRPPNSPPLLLTCLLKDPVPKCRGAAVSVLCSMLEGSKSYLAVADDSPRSTQPFTPYSQTIGGVVREMHRSLLLALTAEPNNTTLTQIVKALSLLVANSPYHQLCVGYIGRVTASLGRLSNHRDLNVQVACLTCYGAVISVFPSHKEVVQWLASSDDLSSTPWLLQHCLSLLQQQSSLSLQTEALQILAALAKFYFPQISGCWTQLKDFYMSHLVSFPRRVQQHVLKMLEELCRALASSPPPGLPLFWEELLGGPLTAILQDYSDHGTLAAQACDILATMSSQTMATIKAPFRILCLTLPLGLSKDATAPSAVIASAVRVLGVFVLFNMLREDENFFLDSQCAISHCLASTAMAVRVQAAWALANLIDSCSSYFQSPRSKVLVSLCEAVLLTLQDGDKVKCNGVRAAGNLLKQLPVQAPSCNAVVDKISLQLVKCVNSGSMKSRWNACYACNSAFSNTVYNVEFATDVSQLVSALCNAVQNCKNFKVRSNAAMALSSAAVSSALGPGQFVEVWGALSQALENSEQQVDFSEFKHASTLKFQLCTGICHLVAGLPSSCVTTTIPPSFGALKDSSRTYMCQFLSRALAAAEEGGDATRAIVDGARRRLEQISEQRCAQNDHYAQDDLFENLLDMFRRNSEDRNSEEQKIH